MPRVIKEGTTGPDIKLEYWKVQIKQDVVYLLVAR